MFFGILGKEEELSQKEIRSVCNEFADQFQNKFCSLLCEELRPEGFKSENPPHLCDDITKKAVSLSVDIINSNNSFTSI